MKLGLHAVQAPPLVPQAAGVSFPRGTQVVGPLQQPLQLDGPQGGSAHAPDWHVWLVGHCAHAAPPVPHCELLSLATGTQALPMQQPAQLVALQPPSI